jgi:glycosyltransferase involved in cell wall biosynthesis
MLKNKCLSGQYGVSLPRELRFAWLLRDDIRNGADIDDPEAQKDFEAWWVAHGHENYPAAASRLDPSSLIHLGEVVCPPQAGELFPLTRLMRGIWRIRSDVSAVRPLDSPQGLAGFVRWFFVYGVPEHNLFQYLSREHLALLLQPSVPASPGIPELSTLGMYAWQVRDDLQAAFRLDGPKDLARFLGWYFCEGVKELGHESYWRIKPPLWLQSDHPGHPGVCWMAYLAWLWLNPDAHDHELSTVDQRQRLMSWFRADVLPRSGLEKLFAGAGNEDQNLPRNKAHGCGIIPKAPTQRAFLPGVNIIGFAKGELGIGEDSRMAALALQEASVPFAVVNIQTGPDTRQQDSALDAHLNDDAPYAVNLFCLTGLDTARVWLERGPELFEGRINIGYWPWELPEWPAVWKDAYSLVDEIWASSRYTQEAFARSSPVPVRLMPMAVTLDRIRYLPRSAFGLPDDAFLFLYVFDFNSYLARKNPWAALKAFRKAFPQGDEPVRLVLKIMNTKADDPRWCAFAAEASQDRRILLLNGTMDRPDVLALFAACDAYVSPHRAEGFGRTLAEAMLLGKPVVATGYSGNVDFLTEETGYPVSGRIVPVGPGEYPFGAGLAWAEPDDDHLACCMRTVWECQEGASIRAENGRTLVGSRHGTRAVGAAYRQRIEELLRL